MNKKLYYSGILLVCLSLLMTFFQNLIHFEIGAKIYYLPWFLSWFIGGSVIELFGTIILLRYYHYKGFKFVFLTGVLFAAAIFCQNSIIYHMLKYNEMHRFYTASNYVMLATGILYGTGLIFSNAGKRLWLKTYGGLLTITVLLTSVFLIWNANTMDMELKVTFAKLQLWLSRAAGLSSISLVLNFWRELQTANTDRPNTRFSLLLKIFTIVPCIILFIFFARLVIQLDKKKLIMKDPSYISEKARGIASVFEARKYVNASGDTLRYRLMLPINYDPTKQYPIVLCLHHGGVHGTDNIIQVEGSYATFLSTYENRRNYPSFLLVPQCPKEASWTEPAIDILLVETIQTLEKEFNIDKKRRYVMGLSGGGYGSWHMISAYPGMFAAAVPICGGGNPRFVKNLTDVKVWAFHGAKDKLAPVGHSREMIRAMKEAGGNPRYTEFPEAGHDIGRLVQDTPGLLDWIFGARRK